MSRRKRERLRRYKGYVRLRELGQHLRDLWERGSAQVTLPARLA